MVISFAEQGAQVAFVDIARDASLALSRRVKEAGYPEPLFRQCDITDIPALQATMAEMAGLVGDFDVLVNNAANDQRHETAEVTQEFWDKCIAINQRPHVLHLPVGIGRHEEKGRRLHHQRRFDLVAREERRLSGVCHHQGRSAWPDPWPGARVRRARHPRQHRHAGLGDDPAPDRPWLDDAGEQDIKRNQCMPTKLMPQHVASMVLFLAADDGAMCTAQEFIVDAGWV
jgi:NAD(P)-dependent dehydrogenase (short-subunit alcohol dehydrogenase family)